MEQIRFFPSAPRFDFGLWNLVLLVLKSQQCLKWVEFDLLTTSKYFTKLLHRGLKLE